jgi:hypothetical protein
MMGNNKLTSLYQFQYISSNPLDKIRRGILKQELYPVNVEFTILCTKDMK